MKIIIEKTDKTIAKLIIIMILSGIVGFLIGYGVK